MVIRDLFFLLLLNQFGILCALVIQLFALRMDSNYVSSLEESLSILSNLRKMFSYTKYYEILGSFALANSIMCG